MTKPRLSVIGCFVHVAVASSMTKPLARHELISRGTDNIKIHQTYMNTYTKAIVFGNLGHKKVFHIVLAPDVRNRFSCDLPSLKVASGQANLGNMSALGTAS